jgi:hypothetical protein
MPSAEALAREYDLIVDAIFGFSFAGEVSSAHRPCCEEIIVRQTEALFLDPRLSPTNPEPSSLSESLRCLVSPVSSQYPLAGLPCCVRCGRPSTVCSVRWGPCSPASRPWSPSTSPAAGTWRTGSARARWPSPCPTCSSRSRRPSSALGEAVKRISPLEATLISPWRSVVDVQDSCIMPRTVCSTPY